MWACLGLWLACLGAVWALFSRVEDTTAPEAKKATSRWLMNLRVEGLFSTWPSRFAALFDHVFGERHLSWKCFRRSCLASVAAVGVVALAATTWGGLGGAMTSLWSLPPGPAVVNWAGRLLFVAGFNLLADYVSLLETRWIIRVMSRARPATHVGALLLADFVLTVGVITLCVSFSTATAALLVHALGLSQRTAGGGWVFEEGFWDHLRRVLTVSEDLMPYGVFIYSTFFTSVWVWAYAVAGLAVKLGGVLGAWGAWVRRVLDIENHPLRSMAMILNAGLTLGFALYIACKLPLR